MSRLPVIGQPGAPAGPSAIGAPLDPEPLPSRGQVGQPGWLSDRQGRRLTYLRLSVTDRCDLRCTYCMPAEGEPASPRREVLTIEELARVVRLFRRLGVKTVRITGGEPLLRRGVDQLIAEIKAAGIDDIAMTTNATALGTLAERLAGAGLRRLNVSLDALDPTAFKKITRGGDVARVVAGIDAARAAGIDQIKTNTVVIRGENDDALADIVRWAWARDITPRFIELMPIGAGAALGPARVVPTAELRERLADLLDVDTAHHPTGRGPAVYHAAADGSGRKVGFISAVTENFCERCNRVRVTAKGQIRACLASPSGLSLRDAMRREADDDRLEAAVSEALFGKRTSHEFYVDGVDRHEDVAMSRVGG